jgi:hypothetical protein
MEIKLLQRKLTKLELQFKFAHEDGKTIIADRILKKAESLGRRLADLLKQAEAAKLVASVEKEAKEKEDK